ncbi:MAG: prephenate dehydrogenase/arogenate dehydrogenase family protein [Myxococcota bacterium]
MPERIAIVGCGLIGGSLGLALRASRPAATVVGIDRGSVLTTAQARGAIDEGWALGPTLAEQVADCDTVLLATPPGVLEQALATLGQTPASGWQLVLDTAGVKGTIMESAQRHGVPAFVGGHPMAGSERSSIAAAREDLFSGRPFVLCPGTDDNALARAEALVRDIGANAILMDATEHDASVAWISHLPHLLAQALVAQVHDPKRREAPAQAAALAAGSWRDVTRVAASSPALWADLFEANADALGDCLDAVIAGLGRARERLRNPQTAGIPVDDPTTLAALRTALTDRLPPTHTPEEG